MIKMVHQFWGKLHRELEWNNQAFSTFLSKQGEPLEIIDNAVPWPTFRPILKKPQKKDRKNNAGRKPYDPDVQDIDATELIQAQG